jgi:hypothetical protein
MRILDGATIALRRSAALDLGLMQPGEIIDDYVLY